jgi:hypothetical protein
MNGLKIFSKGSWDTICNGCIVKSAPHIKVIQTSNVFNYMYPQAAIPQTAAPQVQPPKVINIERINNTSDNMSIDVMGFLTKKIQYCKELYICYRWY